MIGSALDRLIERAVVPSFTSIGPAIRRRLFDWSPLEGHDLSGRVVVLSGGTSGIGEAAAGLFAGCGATLEIVGRDAGRTRALAETLRERSGNLAVDAVIADLGRPDEVRAAARTLAGRHSRIDVLAHNAGALFPRRRRAADGTDLAVELMVAAPFLLTGLLLPRLRAGPTSRVLTMSSGGMYTEPPSVRGLQMSDEDYDGAAQYARAKRAQVTLNALWAARVPPDEVVFHALHPGWVDTPGLGEALPIFSRSLSSLGLLRSARDGADTLVWLAADERALASSGDFWLDREPRPVHRTRRTRAADTPERRDALWRWCEEHTGWSLARERTPVGRPGRA